MAKFYMNRQKLNLCKTNQPVPAMDTACRFAYSLHEESKQYSCSSSRVSSSSFILTSILAVCEDTLL